MRSHRKSRAGSRTALQFAIALAGLVPVGAGLAGVLLGPEMAGPPGGTDLDSHVRYLSGLLLGLGLVFWASIPTIERRAGLVRALTFLVFTGGLARLLGVVLRGPPSGAMLFGLAMELAVTPLLCLWQASIAERR